MSAILEAPVITEDAETAEEGFPGAENPQPGGSFFPPSFGDMEGFLSVDSLGDPSAMPLARGSFFPLPRHSRPGGAPLNVDTSRQPCRPTEPQIPPSPGAALLKEFDPLYHKYQRRVYRQCYRMLGNQEDAEDLTQEVFLQVFRKAHTFRGEANFSTWLYRLTVNTVLMQLRRRRRWHSTVTSMDVAPGSDEVVSDVLTMVSALPESATATLDRIILDVAIAHLSAGYKEILLLHDVEGYRHDEIARLLRISEGTSKSQLHKARLRLRALIGSGDGGGAGSHRAPAARGTRKKHCPAAYPAECVPA